MACNFRKRFDYTNHVRCLTDDVWEDVDDDDDDFDKSSESGDDMDIDNLKLKKPGRYFRNQVCII